MILPACRKTWEDINEDFTKVETVWNEESTFQELVDDYEPSSEDYVHSYYSEYATGENSLFNTQSEDTSLFTRGMNSQTIDFRKRCKQRLGAIGEECCVHWQHSRCDEKYEHDRRFLVWSELKVWI